MDRRQTALPKPDVRFDMCASRLSGHPQLLKPCTQPLHAAVPGAATTSCLPRRWCARTRTRLGRPTRATIESMRGHFLTRVVGNKRPLFLPPPSPRQQCCRAPPGAERLETVRSATNIEVGGVRGGGGGPPKKRKRATPTEKLRRNLRHLNRHRHR